jgi:predicted short-subunit dehydrogenase-like oxidoreductase (DUF2520 family)
MSEGVGLRVGIVGRGRLGRSLDVLLRAAGVDVQLRGRGEPPSDAPIVLLAVPDAAIREALALVPPGPIVLHASGASPVDVLRPRRPVGSFHPLMTFPGPEQLPDLAGVAAAVAGDPEAVDAGRAIAAALGMRAVEVPGERALYHAAAVMAGNFATVLLADAAAVLERAGVDPREARAMLAPLAIASLRNAIDDPARALTGPVARGDEITIAAHREALRGAGLVEVADVYDRLTERARALRH